MDTCCLILFVGLNTDTDEFSSETRCIFMEI